MSSTKLISKSLIHSWHLINGVIMVLLFSSISIYGQIVHVPVNYNGPAGDPDLFDIDIDGAGNNADITVYSYNSSTVLEIVGTTGATEILGIGVPAGALIVDSGISIDASTVIIPGNTYQANQLLMLTIGPAGGNWYDNVYNDNKYIAFRIDYDGIAPFEWHYGWIRMSAHENAGMHWTVVSYAYNTVINEAINAGQTETLGLESDFLSNLEVLSTDTEIKILNLIEPANYQLFSILGHKVKQGLVQDNRHIINTSTLSEGIYILRINGMTSGKLFTKKIILY